MMHRAVPRHGVSLQDTTDEDGALIFGAGGFTEPADTQIHIPRMEVALRGTLRGSTSLFSKVRDSLAVLPADASAEQNIVVPLSQAVRRAILRAQLACGSADDDESAPHDPLPQPL